MDGNLTQIEGYAYYTDSSRPGELTVHFDPSPFDAPYWVLALGDEDPVRAVLCCAVLGCSLPCHVVYRWWWDAPAGSRSTGFSASMSTTYVLYGRRWPGVVETRT